MSTRKRHFERITLFQETTGHLLDMAARDVRMGSGPSEDPSSSRTAAGTQDVQTRSFSIAIPITDDELIQFARFLSRVQERNQHRVGGYMIGAEGSSHITWLELTSLIISNDGDRFFGVSSATAQIDTGVFHPAVSESENLIAAVPWRGTSESGGNLQPIRRGYQGPLWSVDANASVSAAGALSSGNANLRFRCPLPESTLAVEGVNGEDIDYTLKAYDFLDSQIDSASSPLTLPAETWEVEVILTAPQVTPSLIVKDVGEPFGALPRTTQDQIILANTTT